MNDLAETNNRLKIRIKQLESALNLCEIKVDEASENFLDTVHTPTKRLQAESTDSKHKKARLAEDSFGSNLQLMTKILISAGMLILLVHLFFVLKNLLSE